MAGKRGVSKYPVIIYAAIIAVLAALAYGFYRVKTESDILRLMNSEDGSIDHRVDYAVDDLEDIGDDLLFLSRLSSLGEYIRLGDDAGRSRLESDLLAFCERRKRYDQIRFIDRDGMEKARVNFNSGRPEIVAQSDLQDKSGRYYFKDAYMLPEGRIFVSPLDLNIEHGKIEMPLKPMIRFGTPVVDGDGIKQGVVAANYFGRRLIDDIAVYPQQRIKSNPIMLNAESYWLKGLSPEDEWGFMHGNGRTFGKMFPDEWETISSGDSGQFESPEGLFTFRTVYPLYETQVSSTGSPRAFGVSSGTVESGDYFWKVVSYIPADSLGRERRSILYQAVSVFMISSIICLAIAFYISFLMRRRAEARDELLVMNQNLMENERRLKASNRQLKANEQQLTANEQQLKASNLQLRDGKEKLEQEKRAAEVMHGAAIDQEMIIIRLKKEVNALLKAKGEPVKYKAAEDIRLREEWMK